MKKILLLIGSILCFVACKSDQKQKLDASKTTEVNTEINLKLNAKEKFDWTGVYDGIIPCINCDEKRLRIKISIDKSSDFKLKGYDINVENSNFNFDGEIKWINNSVIYISNKNQESRNTSEFYFLVLENELKSLDASLNLLDTKENSLKKML